MTAPAWPDLMQRAGAFYDGPYARPRKLFAEFVARGSGSGRRSGPRDLLWQTVVTSAVAALEAGLEDVLLAAHGARQGAGGTTIQAGVNSPDGNPRKWLVEDRLMAPSAQKITRVLFMDFGLVLGALPPTARFEARAKPSSLGGSGRGTPRPGPATWTELARYLDALSYVRNAAAHGDATKLDKPPATCAGLLWVRKDDGTWSVQQPHALTALRAILSAHNTIVEVLAASLGVAVSAVLTQPDAVDYP